MLLCIKSAADMLHQAAFLVGGFAASEYLYNRLSDHLQSLGIMLSRPDSHVFVLLFLLASLTG